MLPRFISNCFPGYQIIDIKEYLKEKVIKIFLSALPDKLRICEACGTELKAHRGKYPLTIKEFQYINNRVEIHLMREKGDCPKCNTTKSERIEFLSRHSIHMTEFYANQLERMCEIATVSDVAEYYSESPATVWRLDFSNLKYLLQNYKIPEVKRISVDEVYTRRKARYDGESRNMRFFTVVSDLETHKVIWCGEGRNKEVLDTFFILLGKEACNKIDVVAGDQHADYRLSVIEFCPNAKFVWDRFHIMQNFEKVVNDERKKIHEEFRKNSPLKDLTAGKFRFLFLKKNKDRTSLELKHINDVINDNEDCLYLELIKELMLTFFNQHNEKDAEDVLLHVGLWAEEAGFGYLVDWWNNLVDGWDTLKNFFLYRVTSALSEGINNVIKTLKKKAYGYRNMEYFRLKIMQLCGYLNSKFAPQYFQVLALK